MENSSHENYLYIQQMLVMLAVCHTVIVEEKNGKSVYNASSPDELALVNAAKFFGYSFKGRDEDNNLIIDL
jgi:phospholipid-transporting ATPase